MNLFAALKKIRDFERAHLPSLKSIVDFDILIEIGYAEEQARPLTLKQVLLLNISSRTTVRRRLLRLIDQGIIRRRADVNDRRASLLTLSPAKLKLMGKYGGMLTSTFASMN